MAFSFLTGLLGKTSDSILVDIKVKTIIELFETVSNLFAAKHNFNQEIIFTSLLDREKLSSTGLGMGVAIPHGRISGLTEPSIIFVRTNQAFDFAALDKIAVNLFFFLLVPKQATEQHLEILAKIAQFLSDNKTRKILQENSATEIQNLFLQ